VKNGRSWAALPPHLPDVRSDLARYIAEVEECGSPAAT